VITVDSLYRFSTFVGHCDGSLTQVGHFWEAGEAVQSLKIADVNGDGNLDLIASGSSGGNNYGNISGDLLSVMLGDGKGGFAQPQLYRGQLFGYGIASGDLNEDGSLDIITANQDSDSLTVFLNDGSGRFGAPNGEYVGVLNGTSDRGSVNSPLSALVPADVNGDGKPDLVFFSIGNGTAEPNNLFVVLNDGTGHFSVPRVTPIFDALTNPFDFVFADFRNVGHADVIAIGLQFATYKRFVSYAKGNGDGTFAFPTQLPTDGLTLTAADFNHDGKPDVVIARPSSNPASSPYELAIFLGNGDGTFNAVGSIPFGPSGNCGPSRSYVGDFNGDGKLDVLVRMYTNQVPYTCNDVYEFLGNGDGTFAPTYTLYPLHSLSIPTSAIDVNGDGRADLIETEFGTSSFNIIPGGGATSIQASLVSYPVVGQSGTLRLTFATLHRLEFLLRLHRVIRR